MPKCEFIKLTNDETIYQKVQFCIAEFCGTFILVLLGCMSCVFSLIPEPILIESIAFGFGLAVLISVTCFAHISGSHINPAVTLAAVLLGYMPLINMPFYWISQFLGSLTAYGVLYAVSPDLHPENATAFCVNHLNSRINVPQGFAVEFLATMLLIWCVCGVWDVRNSNKHDSVPVKFGLVITGLALCAIPYTSAGLNPARSLGPAIIAGDYVELWIFCLAPLSGSAFGSLFYRLLFEYKDKDLD